MLLERQSNIELLRVIVMFMILLLHANIFTFGWPEGDTLTIVSRLSMESLTIIAVNVFVLITGYFGTSFKISRIANILFQIIFTVFTLSLALIALGLFQFSSWKELIHGFYFWNYWFLNSYLVLVVISPILNLAVNMMKQSSLRFLLIVMFVILSLFDGDFFISPPGIGANSGYSAIWFMFVYLLGRYLKRYPANFNLRSLVLVYLIGLIGSIILMLYCHDYGYNSPFILMQSIAFFLFFLKMDFTSKTINFIASSSLMVFLVHCHPILVEYYKGTIRSLNSECGNGLMFILFLLGFCVIVYCAAICFDQLRKCVWRLLEPRIKTYDKYLTLDVIKE